MNKDTTIWILTIVIGILIMSHLYIDKQVRIDKLQADKKYNELQKQHEVEIKKLKVYIELIYTKLNSNK